jgi:predicted phage terminase large subunit-like protein
MSKVVRERKRGLRELEQYRRKLEILRASKGFNLHETADEQHRRIEAAKADPVTFAETYLPDYCTAKCATFQDQAARRILRTKDIRIVLRWARAHAKSVWADIIIPLWLWAKGEPMYLVIIGSSFDKAKTLLSDVQAEFEANPRLLHDFGEQQMDGNWTDGYFSTKGGFVGAALGMGQSVRGLRKRALRPTYIVLDDTETRQLCKNPKRLAEMVHWVETDVLGTMDGATQRLVIANNRFAPDMIQVRLLEKHKDWICHEVKAYDPVTFLATWPEKYGTDDTYWRDMERKNGSLAVRAEYLNEPHVEGSIFTDDLFNWGRPPRIDHFVCIVGHWDVAYAGTRTADYNAVRVWGLDKDNRYWLIGTYCKQSKMAAAVRWMVQFDKALPDSAVIRWQYESQFWNDELERTVRDVCHEEAHELRLAQAERGKANKYERILTLHPYYQNGRVWYSDKAKSESDALVALAQLKGIEPGYSSHDDAPDADEQAIGVLSREVLAREWNDPVLGERQRPKNIW